jgi:hypothetical protein
VSIGNIVSVKVLVNTEGKIINNAEATVQFPTDLLDVISVSKNSSIFSLWVEDPKFSNYAGTITLNGGLPNPGYAGASGEVVSIVFKAKKSGNASIVFSDSAVRQNDGLGTDILTSKLPTVLEINSSSQLEIPTINTAANSLPLKPIITSSTHPNQDIWYSGTTASFNWSIPNDITSIQTLLSKSPTATPTVPYDASVSQRTVNNLTDGILYFHIRYMNSLGWGPTAHYKVQIDSTPPEKFTTSATTNDVRSLITLNAFDALSGVDSYSITIDNGSPTIVKKDNLVNNEYSLPVQNEGNHNLTVIAYDKAGNQTESKSILVSPAIISPMIIVSPEQIRRGEKVTVSGKTSYPDSRIDIFIQTADGKVKQYTTKTVADATFTFNTDEITVSGSANVWAQLIFLDLVKSTPSDKKLLIVKDGPIIQASRNIIYSLGFIVPAILLILGIIFMLYLGWHKFFGLKRKLNKEMQGTVAEIHKALMLFKEELANQLEKLEKIKEDRDLNRKEEKIFKELQNNIDSIDEFIERKIKKIK